jgi:hypothetical protein
MALQKTAGIAVRYGRLLSASVFILFLASMAIRTGRPGTAQASVLPFTAISENDLDDSTSLTKRTDFHAKIRRNFKKDSTIAAAIQRLKKELSTAEQLGTFDLLFTAFAESPAFSAKKLDTVQAANVIKMWVKDAREQTSEAIRMFYSDYLQALKQHAYTRVPTWYFYPSRYQIRPESDLELTYYPYYYYEAGKKKRSRMACILQIAKLDLDTNFKPLGFTPAIADTIDEIKDWGVYRRKISSPGIYRVSLHNEFHFQQFYFQATWLDGIIKTDNNRMVVFGSSYRDTIAPPYQVYCVSRDGRIYRTQTDNRGVCVLSHRFGDSLRSPQVKVIIARDRQLAFVEGYFSKNAPDTATVYHLYTERPVYRPGHTVFLRGIVRNFMQDREIGPADLDSFPLQVRDPEGIEIYHKSLPVDRWGHFGDSLVLSSTARQGTYFVSSAEVNTGAPLPRRAKAIRFRGSYQSVSFIVEAYKKPEFKITAVPQKEVLLSGEQIALAVSGEYYFGGPLSEVPVTVRWYRQDLYHYFSYWEGQAARCFFYPQGERTLLKQEELRFDGDGKLDLKYKPELTAEYNYVSAEIIATDQSRRQVREEASVKVAKHDAYISIILDKYEYEVGDNARIEIAAVDLAGAPLKGSVGLRVKKDREIVRDDQLTIDKNGRAEATISITEPGRYHLEATIKDSHGKTVYAEQQFQAAKQQWSWNWERVEITPDKKEYGFGDTAKLSVRAGADNTTALCVAEGNRLFDFTVKKLKDHSLQYAIPLTKEMGYNVAFSVIFSGPLMLASASLPITIIDSTLLLSVNVKAKRLFMPGDTFDGVIAVKDRAGKPVEANFSVALVDEAVFAVAENVRQSSEGGYYPYSRESMQGVLDLLPGYYQNRVMTNQNQFSWQFLATLMGIATSREAAGTGFGFMSAAPGGGGGVDSRSRSDKLEAAPLLKAAPGFVAKAKSLDAVLGNVGGQSQPFAPPRERKDFKDLGYWNASVTTSPNGEAPLRFVLPDDLTRWRLVLIGSDASRYLIDFKDSIITRKDIMAKIEAPRSFTVGDSILAATVIHNYADSDVDAKVNFEIRGAQNARLAGSGSRSVRIKKNGTQRVDFPLIITGAGALNLYTAVHTSRGNDAESRTYPVLFHGIPRTIAHSGIIDEKKPSDTVVITVPKDVLPGSRQLTIDYSPTLAYSLFQSLDYLTGYPYGCVEQTMSRFLPNLYVASAMKKLGIRNDSLSANIPRYTKEGLKRLQQLQHGDGGWGWWESDNTDPRMTALVVYGLRYALSFALDSADKQLAQTMFDKGAESVLNQLTSSADDPNIAVNLAYSLLNSSYAAKISKPVEEIYGRRGKLSSYGLALLLECLHALRKPAEEKAVSELLATKADKSGSVVSWSDNSGYGWYGRDEETTARVLHAFVVADPGNPLIPKAVMWLSRKKTNGYWVCTKTTATVIHALAAYLEKSGEFNPRYEAALALNGKPVQSFSVTRNSLNNWAGTVSIPDSALGADSIVICASLKGKGRLYCSIRLQYVTKEEPIKARDNGIEVSRKYTRIIYGKDANGDPKVDRKPFDGTLKSGDEIEVEVQIQVDRACEHMMVEDFFPSGMEVLQKPREWYDRWCKWWWWGYTHKEARDDRMVFFLDYMGKGEQTFRYLLRSETPGKMHGLPAKAELMYDPDVCGNSGEIRVESSDR